MDSIIMTEHAYRKVPFYFLMKRCKDGSKTGVNFEIIHSGSVSISWAAALYMMLWPVSPNSVQPYPEG